MKKLLVSGLLLAMTSSAFAADKKLIKSCSTTLIDPDEGRTSKNEISIFKAGEKLSAKIKQTTDQGTSTFSEVADVVELDVRAGLTLEDDVDKLNLAEKLVVHALNITEDPIFNGIYTAGLDLRKIRSAKVYKVGKETGMGMVAIVEAKDKAGNNLGSFFGGLLVGACK